MPTISSQQRAASEATDDIHHDRDTQQQARTTAVPSLRNVRQRDLPDQLQDAVPSCAQQCLQTYIDQEYSSRCSDNRFDCMCSHYSSQGYTLGELAYICYESSCATKTTPQEEAVYGICSSQTRAVPATHSTLTVPATTATASATSGPSTAIVTASITPSSSAASSRTATSSSSRVSAVPSQASVAAATASPFSTSTALSVGQAVGVSIAAFAAMAAVIALIYCIIQCRKKKARKSKRTDSYDFVDDAPPRFLPPGLAQSHVRWPPSGHVDGRKRSPESHNRAETRFPVIPSDPETVARLTGQRRPSTLAVQRSNESMRTLSKLLPDKPGQTPPQRPQTIWPRPLSTKSPATVFEEDRYSRMPVQQTPPIPRAPPRTLTLPGMQIRPTSRAPIYADQYTRSPDEIRRPSLSLDVPPRARSTNKIPSSNFYVSTPPRQLPPPTFSPGMSAVERLETRSSKAKSGTSTAASDLLSYYASPEAGSQVARTDITVTSPGPATSHPLGSPLTPISLEPQHQVRSPPAFITITKPTLPPRVVGQRPYSTGSNTSFESTDPDEPTPPEEDKQLSPVAEHSPIAAIKYPKIPRSSNQAVPRSPPAQLSTRRTPPRDPARWPPRTPPAQASPRHAPPDGRAGLPSQLQLEHRRQRSIESKHWRTPERQNPEVSPLTGTTLASRRRGDGPECEKKLVIDTSHSRTNSKSSGVRPPPQAQEAPSTKRSPGPRRPAGSRTESPLKGYGRPAYPLRPTAARTTTTPHAFRSAPNGLLPPEMISPGPKVLRYANIDAGHGREGVEITQEVVLQSPLWEPKLTPRRRGDDLILDVGMASPRYHAWRDGSAVWAGDGRDMMVGTAF
ncbi:hypothetical protein Tdes44962_MAKER07712 [Teratosphaeria destructans]|uniref:CFEM domain-containing protein n=1 Tax=Teratosphaeria destructans TaxID=418781 RepID=A0A9W7W5Y5_9PEZI|nr:hypothetical protein Tdes44962_MAKER07712 [Teratosphaeria destructans]